MDVIAGRGTSGNRAIIIPTLQGSNSSMAQTFFQGYLHIVFSTKGRVRFLNPEIEEELFRYIGGIVKAHGAILLIGNGTSDHIHLLISFGKHTDIPRMIGDVKRSTSKLLKQKSPSLSKFAWQEGYSAFTVGHGQLDVVKRYIRRQKEHHQSKLFEEEMQGFYRKYGIEFDEDLVWG
jgi:REP element-mobilizing transposase RayT